MSRNFFNPDAPQPIQHAQGRVNPDAPSIISDREREQYTVRICIAAHREFDLTTVDPRINRDKEWGVRDWAQGAPTATSCLIPVIHQSEIVAKLTQNALVIFAKGSWQVTSVSQAAPVKASESRYTAFPAPDAVEIRYTQNSIGIGDIRTIHPQIKFVRMEPGRVDVISIQKELADEIIAKLKAHPGVTSVNGEPIVDRELQRQNAL